MADSLPLTWRPPLWRIIMAFVCAPTITAIGLACIGPLDAGLPDWGDRVWRTFLLFWIVGALPLTVVFGIPLYFVLRSRVLPTIWYCSAAGAAVLVFPWVLLTLWTFTFLSEEEAGGHVLVLNGYRTFWGWLYLLQSLGEVALVGGIAGAIFWVIAAAGILRREQPANSA